MPRPEWRDAAKERYWRGLLAQWRRSGLTGRAFCAQQALSEARFYGWKRVSVWRTQVADGRPGATMTCRSADNTSREK